MSTTDLKQRKVLALKAIDKNIVRGAGYSASALRGAGYSASALLGAGYSASEVLGAGYLASEVRGAGYSAYALLGAGYSASEVLGAGYSEEDMAEWELIPVLDKMYSIMLADIKEGRRIHKQSTFGDSDCKVTINENGICNTPMCICGHAVQMAGDIGWALKEKYGYVTAGILICSKAHPDYPMQDFEQTNNESAFALLEELAECEANGTTFTL